MKKLILSLLVVTSISLGAMAQVDDATDESLNNSGIVPELSISVQPNPASDFITINADGVENAMVQIIDVLGNVVWNSTISGKGSINVTEFRNGIYYVNVSANGTRASRKVIVRH